MEIKKTLTPIIIKSPKKNKKQNIFEILNFKNINSFQIEFFFLKKFFSWLFTLFIFKKKRHVLEKVFQNSKKKKYFFFLKKKFIFLSMTRISITKSILLLINFFSKQKEKKIMNYSQFLSLSFKKTPLFFRNLFVFEIFRKKKNLNYLKNRILLNQKDFLIYNYLRQLILDTIQYKRFIFNFFRKILKKIYIIKTKSFFEVCFFCLFSRIGVKKELIAFSNFFKKSSYFFNFFNKKTKKFCKNFSISQKKFFLIDLIKNNFVNWNWNFLIWKNFKKKYYWVFFFEKFFQILSIEKNFFLKKSKMVLIFNSIADRKEKTLENSIIRFFQILVEDYYFKLRKFSPFLFLFGFLNSRKQKKKKLILDFLELNLSKKLKKINKSVSSSQIRPNLRENFLIAICYKITKKFQKKKNFRKKFLTDFCENVLFRKFSFNGTIGKEMYFYYFRLLKKNFFAFCSKKCFFFPEKKLLYQFNFFLNKSPNYKQKESVFKIFSIKENIFFFLKKIFIENSLKNKKTKLGKIKFIFLKFKKKTENTDKHFFLKNFEYFQKIFGWFVFTQKNFIFFNSLFYWLLTPTFFFKKKKISFLIQPTASTLKAFSKKGKKNSRKKSFEKVFLFCFGKKDKNFCFYDFRIFYFYPKNLKFILFSLFFRNQNLNLYRNKINLFLKLIFYNEFSLRSQKKIVKKKNGLINIIFIFFKSKFFKKIFKKKWHFKLFLDFFWFKKNNFLFWLTLFPQIFWKILKKQKKIFFDLKKNFFQKNIFRYFKIREKIFKKNFFFLSEIFFQKKKMSFIYYKKNKKKFKKNINFSKFKQETFNQKIFKEVFFFKIHLKKNQDKNQLTKISQKKIQLNIFQIIFAFKKKKKFLKSKFIFFISMFLFFFLDLGLIFKSLQRDPSLRKFEKVLSMEIFDLFLLKKNFFLFKKFMNYFFKIFRKKGKIFYSNKWSKNKFLILSEKLNKFILKNLEFLPFFSQLNLSLKNFFFLEMFKFKNKIFKEKKLEKKLFLPKKIINSFSFFWRLKTINNYSKSFSYSWGGNFFFVNNQWKLSSMKKLKKKKNYRVELIFFFEKLFLKRITE
ncbi:hypothetical protein HAN_3g481 (nucleomorph) [Hemiselmis andersenii]|uniref:Uncharacterized protein n=2 Tax=Hemiselmis andersenii TaxID=464988 RepID=A9BLA0_HEMAN|nr:hypothetical protein HAN_3g481 [Hemiselmis andersenii]ABW98283.1 hypothetical protein HAN_3g481 [Hemiselmis andersenii]